MHFIKNLQHLPGLHLVNGSWWCSWRVSHGATDAYGCYALRGKVRVHDLHATILHLLGLDR